MHAVTLAVLGSTYAITQEPNILATAEARCRLVCLVVRAEPVNLAEFPMNPIDCYTLHNDHAHFLPPEVEHTIIAFQNTFMEKVYCSS